MTSVTPNLIFESPPALGSPTDLVFGGDSQIQVPAVTANVSLTLDSGVVVNAFAVKVVTANALVMLGPVAVSAVGYYDNRVIPFKDYRTTNVSQVAKPDSGSLSSSWAISGKGSREPIDSWQAADRVGASPDVRSETAIPVRSGRTERWSLADARLAESAVVHQVATHHDKERGLPWQVADSVRADRASLMQAGVFKALHALISHDRAAPTVLNMGGKVGASLHYSGVSFFTAPWQRAVAPRSGKSIIIKPVDPDRWWWNGDLLFECPPLAAPALVFGGLSPCDVDPLPEPTDTIIVPVRRVYMVVNEATLRRVDGNVPLTTTAMTLTIDADSWTWGFAASLPGRLLSDLEPASNGAPVEVEALINGVAYRALIDGIDRDRSFGKNDLRITGRGKTALLDAPYAPSRVFTNAVDRTAQQLMNDILTVNNVSMGWNVNFGADDWLIPAGVFNHSGSYISALNTIAAAAGGYIQPHASAMSLSLLPRYKTAPWYWNTVTPDYELPSDVTTREAIQWVERARYNRVYVSGVGQGVLGQVRRAGTAGDILAPMVTDPLITSAVAARNRGMAVLGNTGRQANVSLRLPVLPETGIITPGKFVRYADNGETRLGVVRSVGVDIGMPEIWQTIGVETHV
ncbi:tail protein [Curvibacter phage PCA1]|nr:tail protein [Curvibacter phage PCA1]